MSSNDLTSLSVEELITLFNNTYHTIDYPQDKLEWIIIDDSNESNIDLFPLEENVLYFHMDNPKSYLEKITFKDEPQQSNNPMDQVDKPEINPEDMNTRKTISKIEITNILGINEFNNNIDALKK